MVGEINNDAYYDYVMNGVKPKSKAKEIVFAIIHNLTVRKGIGDEFEMIDSDVQDEIVETWTKEVEKILNE